MKRTITAAILISLMAGPVAMADSSLGSTVRAVAQRQSPESRRDNRADHRDDRHDGRSDRRDDRRDGRSDRRDDRRDDRWDRRDDRRDHRDNRRDDRWDRRDDRRDKHWDRWDDRRDHGHGNYWSGRYDPPRGYRPHHWRRGDRLPAAYYARPYVISDYRGCHLRPPSYGAHWVRVDNDVLLTVIATGIVLDVVYNHFYWS
jgi:Ni/Co efflux regulator RcnB